MQLPLLLSLPRRLPLLLMRLLALLPPLLLLLLLALQVVLLGQRREGYLLLLPVLGADDERALRAALAESLTAVPGLQKELRLLCGACFHQVCVPFYLAV